MRFAYFSAWNTVTLLVERSIFVFKLFKLITE